MLFIFIFPCLCGEQEAPHAFLNSRFNLPHRPFRALYAVFFDHPANAVQKRFFTKGIDFQHNPLAAARGNGGKIYFIRCLKQRNA